ncbi:hypothetical protein D186_23866, partial [Citrobacter freundii ATCC 8090 = MTCC 1658 = NBRC 12681]|uniref:hypothetical protein n=1 Tax=Citrobacter freundii TaxID=546 RepID=UPI000299BFC8
STVSFFSSFKSERDTSLMSVAVVKPSVIIQRKKRRCRANSQARWKASFFSFFVVDKFFYIPGKRSDCLEQLQGIPLFGYGHVIHHPSFL